MNVSLINSCNIQQVYSAIVGIIKYIFGLVLTGHMPELIEYVAPEGKQLDLETCYVGAGHIAFV